MAPSSANILSLLDEILLEILSRLSLNDLTSIPFVCRRFSNLLANNPDFLRLRLLPTLHVFGRNPNGDDSLISLSVPLNSSNWSASIRLPLPRSEPYSLVSLGRSVYIIGHRFAFRHDTWTKTTVPIACPLCASFYCRVVSAINGKLYACTYMYGNTTIGEYDPAADEWRVVASSRVSRGGMVNAYDFVGVGAGGVFYLLGDRVGAFMQGYNVGARQWVGATPGPLPVSTHDCSACGTPAGHLYVISRKDEELRFWRWEGNGEEWMELEPPVVPQTPGYIGRRWLRFRCVAVRDERVAAMVIVVPLDIGDSFFTGMYILVYNVVDGSWSRGPDLPIKFNPELDLVFTEY